MSSTYPNDNSNNNPNKTPTLPKKRRWFRTFQKKYDDYNQQQPNQQHQHNQQQPNQPQGPNQQHQQQQPNQHQQQQPNHQHNQNKRHNSIQDRKQEKLDNDAQVARMEQQLHEYFQKSNTPYTFINDNGIYNYTVRNNNNTNTNLNPNLNLNPNPNNNSITTHPIVNSTQPTVNPTQSGPLFSLFPCTYFANVPLVSIVPVGSNDKPVKPDMSQVKPTTVIPETETVKEPEIEEIVIQEEINHINDLIALCEKYPLSETKNYNVNMKAIHAIKEPLIDLSNMIGMETLKRSIVDQILYYIQELHIKPSNNKGDTNSDKAKDSDDEPLMKSQDTKIQPPPLLFPNPFASTFTPSGSDSERDKSKDSKDISSRLDFDARINPFANLQTVFDFNSLNNKFAESMKKKNASIIGSDFSQPTSGDFMHTVIYGPPGSGKTEVAKIIGRIFSGLGILSKKTFKKVSRHDLVAGYLGQTAIKTKEIIKASLGGVLFIDEAYSLGNSEKRDSFAKECIDTLCEALSEHKNDWMVIIAGYEKELNDCFFNFNDGLNSRFTWRFKLEGYKAGEMKQILEKKVKEYNWTIAEGEKIQEAWFASRMDYFTTYGRDMETLFTKMKIAHSRRVFCLPKTVKTQITVKDLENGFELFLENPEVKERKDRNGVGNYMKSLYV
jgi:chromosomal replication initiation ATPase DnaA